MISAASSAGDASMNLSGWNSAREASARRSSRASSAVRPTSPVSIPARLTASRGRPNASAIAASSRPSRRPIRSSPASTLTIAAGGPGCGSGEQRLEDRCLRGRSGRRLDRVEGRADLDAGWAPRPGPGRARPPRAPPTPRSRCRTTGRRRHAGRRRLRPPCAATAAGQPGPAHAERALVGLGERAARQEHRRHGQLVGGEPGEVGGEDRGLLAGLRRRGDALGRLAPAAHAGDGIGFQRCSIGDGSPTTLTAISSCCAGTRATTCATSCAGTRTRRSRA